MCWRIPSVKVLSLGKIRWFSVLILGFLLLTAAGCGRHGKAAPIGGSDIPPSQTRLKRSVELDRATQQALTYYVETVGYLEAEGQTDIAAGVSGVVDEVLFREGQWVDSNSVLVKVDQRRYVAAAEVARANAKRAEASLALAKDVADRARRLVGRGVSDEEQSKAMLTLRMADAELASSRAAVILAEHNLERSQVRAPYPGQINQRKVTPGTYLEEKTVIATVADLRRLRLVGWVPEKAAPTARLLMAQENRQRMGRMVANCLAAGTAPLGGLAGVSLDSQVSTPSGFALEFTLMAYPKLPFHGRIFYLSSVANPDTHMFECKADVDTSGVDVELKPGFTARIKCPLHGNPNACVIPEEAVRASERGFIAFVPAARTGKDGVEEWVARARELKLGFRGQGTVEVLEGISPGEWLVRKGAESLEDGTPINLSEEQAQQLKALHN
jgi:multidrug efflux system membrane fusion protein